MANFGSESGNQGPRVYTVSSLTEEIRTLLEDHFEFVWVEAEISNFRMPSSGHYYMVLKDAKSQIRAVMFRPQARYLKFVPEDGMKILAQGRVGVYAPRGEYQIVLDYLEPLGVGALALAFEQLKRKLAEQGLFDESIKRPLPFLPSRVAVITSPTGAAIRDFLKIIHRRFANIEVTILPVKVQGEGAADEMVEALETANSILKVDVIVLTRGGGSLEDLWAFNQESLARAIRASRIPVVSAVGHEIDTTISDLAADMRAPTPSAAAEMLVVEKESISARLSDQGRRLHALLTARLEGMKQELLFLSKQLRDPRRRIGDHWMRLDEIRGRLIRMANFMIREGKIRVAGEMRALATQAPLRRIPSLKKNLGFLERNLGLLMVKRLEGGKASLLFLEGKIKDMGPMAVLKRGYSITLALPEGRVLKNSSDVAVKDEVRVILAEGSMRCRVEGKEEETNASGAGKNVYRA